MLHRRSPYGDAFKLLGGLFDVRMFMEPAINEIAAQAHVRLKALLRGRHFFSDKALVNMYKMQVLSYMEFATPAVYHAPRFFLQRLDAVQACFLEEIGNSSQDALLKFNLAPLAARRDIALLALIHRTAVGDGPAQFQQHFFPERRPHFPRSLRPEAGRHHRQLHDPIDGSVTNAFGRSIFSLIYVYNMLPDSVVKGPKLPSFQRALQNSLKHACQGRARNWETLLSNGVRSMSLRSFHSHFC